MILEPYNITIIDLEKDDCSYVNDVIRVGKDNYYRLTSKSYKLDKGHFVGFTTHAPIPISSSLTLIHGETYFSEIARSFGTFVRVRDTLFLEEELANFYAWI